MRPLILAAAAFCTVLAVADGARGQTPPAEQARPPEPSVGQAAPPAEPVASGRPRGNARAPAQPGGIYARPGRCRELAIKRNLYGLARQRFIKRCRIARRTTPRPATTIPGPAAPSPSASAKP